MKLLFTLSMPNNNSWNGRWSGASKNYCATRSFRGNKPEEKARALVGSHYYNFGDGWGASIAVVEIAGRTPKSDGFCGYEWMIDSLIAHGKILNHAQKADLRESEKAQALQERNDFSRAEDETRHLGEEFAHDNF